LLRDATGHGRGDAAFSPDGSLFATSDWEGDGHSYVWDTASGDLVARLGNVAGLSLRFSPDDRVLAFGGSDGDTHVYELGTGDKVNQLSGADPLAFSPDGERLLIGDAYWDATTAPVVVDLDGPTGGTRAVTLAGGRQGVGARTGAWSPDGSSVATLTASEIVVWNARSGDERFPILPPTGSFTSVAFGPRSLLATGMGNGTAIVWSLSGGSAEPLLTLGGHASEVGSVSFSADGTRLSTASDDGDVHIWDMRPEGAHEGIAVPGSSAVSFSPDGHALAAGSEEGTIVIYVATTGETILRVSERSGPVNAIAFDPSGSALASAGSDGTARLFDATTGAEVWSVPDAPSDSNPVLDVGFGPDGRSVATATFANDEPVDLWDVGTGDHLRALPYDIYDANAGHAVAFSRDGRFVAGSGFTFVRVWRLSDETHVQIETGVVDALDFSPDGSLLVTGTNDGSVRLWDTTTGKGVASASGNLGEVTDVAFSPDGATIATISSDGSVRLWRGRTLQPLMTIATDAAGISETTNFPEGEVSFGPDGTRLAYTAEDGMVRVLVLKIDDLIGLAEARLSRS
jgi:WD40 repeat protein